MNILSFISKKNRDRALGLLLLATTVLVLQIPQFTFAQTAGAGATPSGGVLSTIGNSIANAAGNAVTGILNGPGGSNPQPTTCDQSWSATFNPTCWGRSLAAWLAAILISLSAWILAVAGMLFNFLVDHTILNFGKFLYSDGANGAPGIKTAVETAWTAFRDISNIVIIGMFVFIAISTILGSAEFGAKKMVAKILIVAVLINFSLLFTKVIIDFSNFTALQFYNAAQLQPEDPTATDGTNPVPGTGYAQKGIAGAFINFMGVTGFGNAKDAVKRTAESNDDGIIAFLHGVMSAFFLLAAAVVLFYGSFLLASRGILLIFLLLTSSIAFATYLIPEKVMGGKFGWSMWWNSLLKTAIFAPLLMVLLWVTLAVGQGLKATGGTLGGLMDNPTQSSNYGALFSYIIVLGLLFMSFKIAASFSNDIAGFKWASVLPAGIAGLGAQFGALAGRRTVGRIGYRVGEEFAARAKDLDGKGRSQGMRNLYDFASKPFKAAAKSDMNVLKNSFGSQLAKTAGMRPDSLTGPKVGGFAAEEVARAKHELAHSAATSSSDKEKAEFAALPGKSAADKKTAAIVREEALKAGLEARPKEKEAHENAAKEVKLNKETIKAMQRSNSDELSKLSSSIKGMQQQAVSLKLGKSDTEKIKVDEDTKNKIRDAHLETARHLKENNQHIREANAKAREASHTQRDIERRIAGHLEDTATATKGGASKIKSTASRFSETLSKAVSGLKPITTPAGNFQKLKEATSKAEKRKKIIQEREMARMKIVDESKPAPEPKDEGGGSH